MSLALGESGRWRCQVMPTGRSTFGNCSGSTAISVTGDSPVAREVADVNANVLGASFVGVSFNIILPAGLKAAGMEPQ